MDRNNVRLLADQESESPSQPSEFGGATIAYGNAKSLLTLASGFMSQYKYTLNPYSGCGFGCDYCYARFFVPTAKQRVDWGAWVFVKKNGCELMNSACRSGLLKTGDAVYMSSVTDPYQPIERRLQLTRSILEAILESGVQPRLTVQTRSPIVTRDVDLLRQFERIRVNFTIDTDSEDVRRRYEPRCPSIAARFKAAEEIASAGVKIGVSISPMLPIKDINAFGARLADLNAGEYVTQYLKPGRSRFAGGGNAGTAHMLREDSWGIKEYQRSRNLLAEILGEGRPLLEGANGYAPA